MLGCVLWAASALALDPALDASQYGHTAWRVREGFAGRQILSFAQTPDGYLWLGTESGLLRFDGVRSTAWVPPRGASLPSEYVRVLLAARNGVLWIGTLGGLAAWDGRSLVTYPQLDGRPVSALVEDREGTVWVGATTTDSGLLCEIRGATTECHRQETVGVDLYEQSDGVLWVAGIDRVWRWKPAPRKAYPLSDQLVSTQNLSEAASGALLVVTRNGLQRIMDGRTEPYPIPGMRKELRPNAVLRDRDGGLWIGSRDAGLHHVHGGRTDAFGRADGLSGDWVLRLFEDREGNVWVATNEGIDRFRPLATATYAQRQGISTPASVLATRDGSVWISTVSGLRRWHGGRLAEVEVRGLPGTAWASLFQDGSGRIWVGTHAGLGYVENGAYHPIPAVPAGYIDSFAEDKEGNLWLAHREIGLLRISPDRRVDTQWEDKSLLARRLAADPVRGGIWIGSFAGGLAYFANGRIAASYSARDGLGKGRVNQVRVAPDGTVWAATEGGLSRLKDGRFATLGSRDGLPCDSVNWMIEDGQHAWWLNTACGLVRLAQSELDAWAAAADAGKAPRPTVATVLDIGEGVRGLASLSTFTPHAARAGDGSLWFGSRDGVTMLDPRNLRLNKQPPPVHVEAVIADRKPYETSSAVQLPPLVRDVHIEYTATSLVAPEKMQFKYKLEGRDKDWMDAGNRRQAFYTDLDPGKYRFRVIASNNSGVWNEQGASLDFSVTPAYWQTWWFRGLCVAALGALLFALYRWRVRQLGREFNLTLDARVAERTRIARELHDTLLQGFHGVLLKFQTVFELLPAGEAKRIQGNAIDQAAEAITEGRDAVQGLRTSVTETNDLAESIRSLGDELAEEAGGKVVVRMEALGVSRALHPIVRDEIFRIASEALRNAFRHSGAQRIEMELRYGERELRLSVRDDGRGIAPEVLSAGGREGHFGLHGMRERAKVIGGKLTVWSAGQAGTEVELTVPAANAYAAKLESAA
ncbi:MAG TPA: two-component regulator propeller domain-containing protein [Burkholderiales bacterium]|nr:two-component regulator propeller domain-containing protein [Burkholderiales bacterium]